LRRLTAGFAIDLAVFLERFASGKRKMTQIIAKQYDMSWLTI
jgi:hypothetical protein